MTGNIVANPPSPAEVASARSGSEKPQQLGHKARTYSIPIFESGVRSLNWSNPVSMVVYETLRQTGTIG